MQVYVSKGGKQYGPYAVDQLRQLVEEGNFAPTDHACHDGANWTTIAGVPGFAQTTEPAVRQQAGKPAKKSRKKLYLVAGFSTLFVAASSAGLYFALSGNEDGAGEPAKAVAGVQAPPGELFILTPEALVSVYDGDTFKVDLKGIHPLFGDDVSIRLHGVDTPEIRGGEDRVKALAAKARDMAEGLLRGAKRIELRNPQRGKYFRIVADVYLDGESLAEKLKAAGLAKDYDGEGEKPVW